MHFVSIILLCELPGNLHPFVWPNSAGLAPWDSPVQFQMNKAVSIHPLPVTATAHRCLSPVPQTFQLRSFVYMNCTYFNQKSGHCTSVIWKANLSHTACFKQKTVGKHLQENQAGQGSSILPSGRKQLCSCLPQLPRVPQVWLELLSFTTCNASGSLFYFKDGLHGCNAVRKVTLWPRMCKWR